MERKSEITRQTSETDIKLSLKLGSIEKSKIDTGVPFLDHMMGAIAKHGRMCIDLKCKGDTHIDDHHSVEDIGICFGKALKEALGDKAGIVRFGFSSVPMDEALCQASIDLSGRSYFVYQGPELNGYIGKYDEELTKEFLYSLAANAEMNLHVNVVAGQNRHHIHEAIFKSLAVAIYKAYTYDKLLGNQVLSTKGTIS
jgi:imidazoleglycerol-phosphate dehydratase